MRGSRKRYWGGHDELAGNSNEDIRRANEVDKQETLRQSKNLAKVVQVQNEKLRQGINVVRRMKDYDFNY